MYILVVAVSILQVLFRRFFYPLRPLKGEHSPWGATLRCIGVFRRVKLYRFKIAPGCLTVFGGFGLCLFAERKDTNRNRQMVAMGQSHSNKTQYNLTP